MSESEEDMEIPNTSKKKGKRIPFPGSPQRVDSKKPRINEQKCQQAKLKQQQKSQQANSSHKNIIPIQQGDDIDTPSKAAKPIFTAAALNVVRTICQKLNLEAKPTYKVSNNSSTQIICKSADDKKKVIQALKDSKVDHHTFCEKTEKAFSAVLKGFYDIEPEELLKILKKENVPATKAKTLFKNENYSLYLVIFQQHSTNCNVLNHANRVIDDISVKWEPVKNKSNVPLQCHHCQRWGHSATGCGYKFRCVKCLNSHQIGQCPRITRTEGSPQCVNCKGDHAANHKECASFKDFMNKLSIKKAQQTRPNQQLQDRLVQSRAEFPNLTRASPASPATPTTSAASNQIKRPTYAEQVKQTSAVNNSNESYSKFTQLSELAGELEEVPNIQKSLNLLKKLIEELKKETCDKKRVYIILQYYFDFKIPDQRDLDELGIVMPSSSHNGT